MSYTYQLKKAASRKSVDLLNYASDIVKATSKYPVRLAGMSNSEYRIEIDKDAKKTKNQIVRAMGKYMANNTRLRACFE